jgi:hypothetical protein
MEWQPIETAPKDGTRILVWCEDEGIVAVEWTIFGWEPQPTNYYTENVCPLWWQPLPEPPAQKAFDPGDQGG